MAGEITNEQLLREIRGVNARVGDVMRRVQQMERNIIAANDKPAHTKSNRNNVPASFDIKTTK